MIKGIFFDVGGTLCSSSGDLNLKPSFKRVLATFANQSPTYFNVKRQGYLWQSSGPKEKLIKRLCQDLKIDNCRDLYNKLSKFTYEVSFYEDVKPCLEKLSKNHQLGLLSNTTIWTAFDHNQLGIGRYVKISILSCKVGVAKPKVDIFRHAQRAVDLKPHELLYVGDSVEYDVKPALKAGWRAVLLCRGGNIQNSPSPIVSNLFELENILLKFKYAN